MDNTTNSGNVNVLELIEQSIQNGSKGHRKIGKYLLQNYVAASYMTAARLSQEIGISESTMVRYAMELGFDGYPRLQAAIKNAVKNKLTSVQRIAVADKRIGDDVLSSSLHSDIDSLKRTLGSLPKEAFDEAVNIILDAKTLYIIGNRSSTALSSFFGFYLNLLFKDVRLVQNVSGSEIFEQLIHVQDGDAVFGISFPRYSKRTVDAMYFAKRSGAKVIALTDSDQSPIANLADVTLLAANDINSFVDSLVAPMAVLNALIAAIGQRRKEQISTTFTKLEGIWEDYDVYDKDDK